MASKNSKTKKILLTGGAGFIGAALIKLWLKEDPSVEIVNFDKLTYSGDLSRLDEVKTNSRYKFFKGDICSADDVAKAMAGCDYVVHLAAESHVDRSLHYAKTFFDTNTYGTYILLEEAKKRGIKKFIHVSTDEVYGSRAKGFFTEKDMLNPSSPYSVSKTSSDLLALAYAHGQHQPICVTRGANTYGPYQYPEKVIPLFVSNALSGESLPLYGDGKQIRNWIHVNDHARGIITVFNKGKAGEVYNIASKNYLENIVMTKRLLKLLGKPESLIKRVADRIAHDRRYAMSSAKLQKLGWKEREPFEQGFRDAVLWYRDHDDWWKAIKEKSREFQAFYSKAYAGRV